MPSQIQSVYGMSSRGWTATRMRAWLKSEGLKPIKRVQKEGDEMRYRIRLPGRYSRFTTKVLPNGIHLVLGWP